MPPTTNPALTNAPLNAFLTQVENQIIVPIITLLSLIAFVVFIWGVIDYIRTADNDEKRKVGQQHIIWGIVGLVIIFATTAIISLIRVFVNII